MNICEGCRVPSLSERMNPDSDYYVSCTNCPCFNCPDKDDCHGLCGVSDSRPEV